MIVQVLIRADASVEMGSGHVMRCLSLAERLKSQGAEVSFISRNLPGNLNEFIMNKGWNVYSLPYREKTGIVEGILAHEHWLGEHWETDCRQTLEILKKKTKIDWLIVDHYALDYRWERSLRSTVEHIMVIDDLADRKHQADLLLDQNLHRNMEKRYQGLVSEYCRLLLGPHYALLRREFLDKRTHLRQRKCEVKRILVFFGGSDPRGVTLMAVRAFLRMNRFDLDFDVVVGESNPVKEQIREQCAQYQNFHYHCQVDDIAALIEQADLAFGAIGASVWERLCLGLPSIVVSVAQNQDALLEGIIDKELLIVMGHISSVSEEHFSQELNMALQDTGRKRLGKMSKAALDYVDGMGCDRVVSVINAISKEQ